MVAVMDTYSESPGSDQGPAHRWRGPYGYVAATAALLAVGIFGGVALAGNAGPPAGQPVPAAATGSASQAGTPNQAGAASPAGSAGPTGQAAVLSAVLSSAGASQAATATTVVPASAARRCRLAIRRLRATGRHHAARAVRRHCRRLIRRRIGIRLLGGMYGQFTFRTAAGTRAIAYERGTVTSDDGSSVVVRAADGTTQTWQVVSDSVVRRDGSRVGVSALAAGQAVFVAGPVVSGVHDIRLAVIRPAAPGNAGAGS